MMIFHNQFLSVEFKDNVIDTLKRYTQNFPEAPESGGILMGKRLLNGNILVTDITIPQKGDISGRYYFKKNKKIHQQLSDKIWEESLGKIIYVGEWHTHPEKIPRPSSIDLRGWRLNTRDQIDNKNYIFLIVGINEFGLWSNSKENGLFKMELIQNQQIRNEIR